MMQILKRLSFSMLTVFYLSIVLPSSSAQENHPAFEPVQDDPGLPRVLLIGDSISIGYTLPVREKLAGIANVHRISVNGGDTNRGVKNIKQWLGKGDWDVIHFNWGLHDIKLAENNKHQVSLKKYRENLQVLIEEMKKTGANLIWASTTPVPEGELSPRRKPGDEVRYNQAAAEIMKAHKIPINDLYSFAKKRLDEIQQPENVHFTEKGYELLAEQVANVILTRLKH